MFSLTLIEFSPHRDPELYLHMFGRHTSPEAMVSVYRSVC